MSLPILYVGNDLALKGFLQDSLGIKVVRCVGQSAAELLIRNIRYSAVLLDEAEKELESFIHQLRLQKKTLVIVISGSSESVAETIRRSLH